MLTIEWRTNNAYDSLLIICESEAIRTVFSPADHAEIQDCLVALGDLSAWDGLDPDPDITPEDYGSLVMRRSEDGTVLALDPPTFAARLAFWFRGN